MNHLSGIKRSYEQFEEKLDVKHKKLEPVNLEALPRELLELIFSFTGSADHAAMKLVSKKWYRIVYDMEDGELIKEEIEDTLNHPTLTKYNECFPNEMTQLSKVSSYFLFKNPSQEEKELLLICSKLFQQIFTFKSSIVVPNLAMNNHMALPIAVDAGDIRLVKHLLNNKDMSGEKIDLAMEIACRKNNLEIVQLLMLHPNFKIEPEKQFFLESACAANSYEVVKFLLSMENIEITVDDFRAALLGIERRSPTDIRSGNSRNDFLKLFVNHPQYEINILPRLTSREKHNINLIKNGIYSINKTYHYFN